MLTADPRVVKGSKLIEQIRFDEASELASFGAKVLHPNTIAPAVRLGIPVFIYNSRKPNGKGTRITFDAPRRAVSAIAGKGGITVVKVGAAQDAVRARIPASRVRDLREERTSRSMSLRRPKCPSR